MPYIRVQRKRSLIPATLPPVSSAIPAPVLVWTPTMIDGVHREAFTRVIAGSQDVAGTVERGVTRLWMGGGGHVLPLTTVPYFAPPATVLAVWRSNGAGLANPFFSFGGSGVGAGWRVGVSTGNVYSVTFGGVADYHSSVSATTTKAHCVAFALGGSASNYDVVEDGVYRGTTNTPGTVGASAFRASVAAANEEFGAQCHIALVVVWNQRLPRGLLARLTANPDLIWAPQRSMIYVPPAGGGGTTSSFAAILDALGAAAAATARSGGLAGNAGVLSSGAASKSVSAGLEAIIGALGGTAGEKAAQNGISAIAGLLGDITHATARVTTLEAKAGGTGTVTGLHAAIKALQGLAGVCGTVLPEESDDRFATIQGIAGAAVALAAQTARAAALAAQHGLLGASTAQTIRSAELAAIAGLKVAISGINGLTAGKLLTVALADERAYLCALSEQRAYRCALNEAIVH